MTVVTTATTDRAAGTERLSPRIRVERVAPLRVPRDVPALRGLEHLWTPLAYLLPSLRTGPHDVALVYSPPLPLGLAAFFLRRLTGARSVINIQDLYPKTAVDLGLLRSRLALKLAEALERFVYRSSDAVTVHSSGNAKHVIAQGGDAARVRVVFNWVDIEAPIHAERSALARYAPDDRFVVFYGGAMGWAQALDDILETAVLLRHRHDILFLLVGDGVARAGAEQRAAREGLDNVRFVRPVPPEEYGRILAVADVSLVTLRHELASPVVPGKLQAIMAAGRPVLVSTNPASDARTFVLEAGCGLFVEAGRPAELADAILRLEKDPEGRRAMGQRGYAYAARHFNRASCTAEYEALFQELVG